MKGFKFNVNAPVFIPEGRLPHDCNQCSFCLRTDGTNLIRNNDILKNSESIGVANNDITIYDQSVQVGDGLVKTNVFEGYALTCSHIEEFWTADVRHLGVQTELKLKSELNDCQEASTSYSAAVKKKKGKPQKNPPVSSKCINENDQNLAEKLEKSKNNNVQQSKRNKKCEVTLFEYLFPVKENTAKGLMISEKLQQTAISVANIEKERPRKKPSNNNAPNMQGNILDASAPNLHKGRHKENKRKKPSIMKKLILNERELKKQGPIENDAPGSSNILDVRPSDLPVENQKQEKSIYNRNFRQYCENIVTPELNHVLTNLLKELIRFQDRQHEKDPAKAKIKRRMVLGFREVLKMLDVQKVKLVIVAPNVEDVKSEGGLNEALGQILSTCREQMVPYAFALSRMHLGYVTLKRRPISCAGILNYQGADAYFKQALEILATCREMLAAKITPKIEETTNDPEEGDPKCDTSHT